MLRFSLEGLFTARSIGKKLIRSIVTANDEMVIRPHIYKKRYTEDELLKHLADNIVYESDDFFVSNVPQGIEIWDKNRKYFDFEGESVCDASLQSIITKIKQIFNKSNRVFVTKYPRRNASGLLIISKNITNFHYLTNQMNNYINAYKQIHSYLAVVSGCPKKTVDQIFGILQVTVGDRLETEVIRDVSERRKLCKTKYSHKVIASNGSVSLVRINVSYDERDCVRHILAQQCFCPVFGDLWNMKKGANFFMGAPLKSSFTNVTNDAFKMDPEILSKLELNPGEENCIPIHIHFFGLNLPLDKKSVFFVTVPPPESFVWTCRQFGLNEIEDFLHN